MNLADVTRKPLVAMSDGAKVGVVSDLLIDPRAWTVVGLALEAGGSLPMAVVQSVGPDAVTIQRADLIGSSPHEGAMAFTALCSLIVVDGSGTNLGNVADLAFEADGAIRRFEIHHGGVFGLGVKTTPFAPSDIRGMGDRLLTVDLAPAPNGG